MSDHRVFIYPLSAEVYESLAKLSRKLDARLKIDHVSENDWARVIHDGANYYIDFNGRCTRTASIKEEVDLD